MKPTIDAGGQMIIVSRTNKRKLASLFKQIYRGAPGNGFVKHFIPWTARPGRDQQWYEDTRANVPEGEGMSPDLYMEENYPATEDEALRPTQAHAFFNQIALGSMIEGCSDPMETRLGGLVRIWKPRVIGARYIVGGDVSWGETGAYSCVPMIDWQTGEQVAEIYGRPNLDELAEQIVLLSREYNNAFCGIESNGEGINVVDKMVGLGYGEHMYWRDWQSKTQRKPGWLTDKHTRPVMLGELAEAVEKRRIIPRCRVGVSEFSSFIRTEKGRPEGAQGSHDDHPMAWAILWQMRHHAKWPSAAGGGRARFSEEELVDARL